MSKISELSDGGALQSTDYLIAVRSGGNVKVQPAGMTFSSVTITSSDINGGTIDGTVIGGATPAAGSFTTVGTSSNVTVGGTLDVSGLSSFSAAEATGNVTTTSSGGLKLKIGKIAGVPSDATDAFVAIQDSGGPGALAGDLILIPRSSNTVDNAIRLFSGYTTPIERLNVGYSEMVVNDPGGNYDFRVKSDTSTHALFVDASANKVGILNSAPKAALHISGDIISGSAPATNGSVALWNEYSSPSGDFIALWGTQWASGGPFMAYGLRSNGDADWKSTYDNFNGTHSVAVLDGPSFKVRADETSSQTAVGSAVTTYEYFSTGRFGTIFNEDSRDVDFRVESDNQTHMLFVDASENFVGINTSSTDYISALTLSNKSGGNAVAIGSASPITGSGEYAQFAEGVLAVDTVSSGNTLSIPIQSQGSKWERYIIEFMFSSGEYNASSNSTAGTLKVCFASLTSLGGVTELDKTGNVSGVTSSGMNLQVTFTTGFTSGLNNYEGVMVYYKILGSRARYVQIWNATLN